MTDSREIREAVHPIRVWRFREAPLAWQKLSPHGGDEDWLAHVPVHLSKAYIRWLEEPHFACFSVSEHPLPDGSKVVIGAHS
jgi:hypothetical protein